MNDIQDIMVLMFITLNILLIFLHETKHSLLPLIIYDLLLIITVVILLGNHLYYSRV